MLDKLKDKYRSYRYDLLNNNCNHFVNEFLGILYDGKRRLPSWINRASRFGGLFSCLIPDRYLNNTKDGKEDEAQRLKIKWDLEAKEREEREACEETT